VIYFGILLDSEARLVDALGEAKVGQARCDDVERRLVGRRICEKRQQFCDFKVAPGPAVAKEQGNGVWAGAALVHEVDVKAAEGVDGDGRLEVRQAIELGFVTAPIVTGLPVRDQPLELAERRAIFLVVGE
jgi:hypothetical protein